MSEADAAGSRSDGGGVERVRLAPDSAEWDAERREAAIPREISLDSDGTREEPDPPAE